MSLKTRDLLAGFAISLASSTWVQASATHNLLLQTDQLLQARTTERTPADQAAVTAALQDQLEYLRAWSASMTHADTNFRKAHQLRAFAEQSLRQPASFAPSGLPMATDLHLAANGPGKACESAIELRAGDARRMQMGAQQSLWVRVDMPKPAGLRLSTRGSNVDTALSVWSDCREQTSSPRASGDDNFGLQAEVAAPAGTQSYWVVRLDNLSPKAGTVSFAAVRAAVIQGSVVRDADSQPIQDVLVSAFSVDGSAPQFIAVVQPNANGNYSIAMSGAGHFAVRTGDIFSFGGDFIHQAFDQRICSDAYYYDLASCGTTGNNYTPIALGDPDSRVIDFRLTTAPILTGRVVSDIGATPVVNASVRIYNAQGSTLAETITDSSGRYRIGGLNAQTVYVSASAIDHQSEIFDNIPCPSSFSCAIAGATPLSLALDQQTRVDFELHRQQVVNVAVTLSGSTQFGNDFFGVATLLNSNGVAVASNAIFEPNIKLGPVAPGEYRLRITSNSSYPALYQGVECATDCLAELALATPVVVSANTVSTDVAMDLRAYPRLDGQITADTSGAAIVGATVNLIVPNAGIARQAVTDSSGNYVFPYVPTGTYLLQTTAMGWTDELYDNLPCESFNPALECPGGTLLNFTPASSGRTINMQLARAASMSGSLNQSYSNSSFADLYLLDSNGLIVRGYSVFLGAGGNYTLTDIPPGTYFIAARGFNTIPQLHAMLDCPAAVSGSYASCDLASAQSLSFGIASTITGIDFNLRIAGARRIQVVSAETGAALSGITVDLWRNRFNRVDSRVTDASGFADVIIPFANGTENLYVSTDNTRGLVNEVYDNIACPNGSVYFGLCSLTGGTPLTLPVVGIEPPTVITLADPDFIFGHGFED